MSISPAYAPEFQAASDTDPGVTRATRKALEEGALEQESDNSVKTVSRHAATRAMASRGFLRRV